MRAPVVVLLLAASALGCASDGSGAPATTSAPVSTATAAGPTTTALAGPVEITIRIERRVFDPATEGFADSVVATLADERGWQQAGFRFTFDDPAAPFLVVLADGIEVDALCAPYDVDGRFSCQLGPVVALNADRWREATPEWTGDLATYRQMLVNHEVGHLLGQHHPDVQCPEPGEPAPVMAQQSTELGGCLPNPWPLEWELTCAARHVEPLAPPYEPDPAPTCGPEG